MKQWLYIIGLCLLAACSSAPEDAVKVDVLPEIYPDYVGVTIPADIAPLDFNLAGRMNEICREMDLKEIDITQITVSKMNAKGAFDIQPAPWLITCHGE